MSSSTVTVDHASSCSATRAQQHSDRGPRPSGLWLPVRSRTATVAHAPASAGYPCASALSPWTTPFHAVLPVSSSTVTVAHASSCSATRVQQHSDRGPRLLEIYMGSASSRRLIPCELRVAQNNWPYHCMPRLLEPFKVIPLLDDLLYECIPVC